MKERQQEDIKIQSYKHRKLILC